MFHRGPGGHPFRKIVETAGIPPPGSTLERRAKALDYYDQGVELLMKNEFPEAIAAFYNAIMQDQSSVYLTAEIMPQWESAVKSVTKDVNYDKILPPLLRIQRRIFVSHAYMAVPDAQPVVVQVLLTALAQLSESAVPEISLKFRGAHRPHVGGEQDQDALWARPVDAVQDQRWFESLDFQREKR